VLVIDRRPLYRAGLVSALTKAGYQVEERECVEEPHNSQIAVLSIQDEGSCGLFRSACANVQVIAIISDASVSPAAMSAGASATVLDDASPDSFVLAVSAVMAGFMLVPQQAASLLRIPSSPSGRREASDIERSWLLALSEGSTVCELA
jgi:DNA-binding NarL/FixJ family response regulator